ncbi:MAG: hypothetical protein EU548_05895 [Promethearchaeota archaeon]|nr:MAG: hypothetical protein EU548_05895 [Candidatus Lokiarchaeota archaeon]
MKTKFHQIKSSRFLGKQLSRLKMGQSYYSILTSTVSAISLASLAFQINFLWLIMVFPFLILCTYLIGYYLDIKNVNTIDQLKSNEMTHRFLNTSDIKSQEFQLLITEMLIRALQKGETFDSSVLREKYEEYKKKWKSPDFLLKT